MNHILLPNSSQTEWSQVDVRTYAHSLQFINEAILRYLLLTFPDFTMVFIPYDWFFFLFATYYSKAYLKGYMLTWVSRDKHIVTYVCNYSMLHIQTNK